MWLAFLLHKIREKGLSKCKSTRFGKNIRIFKVSKLHLGYKTLVSQGNHYKWWWNLFSYFMQEKCEWHLLQYSLINIHFLIVLKHACLGSLSGNHLENIWVSVTKNICFVTKPSRWFIRLHIYMILSCHSSNLLLILHKQYLDENKSLILKIVESQNSGKLSECAE